MNVTEELARIAVSGRTRQLDDVVRYEAQRLLIDWFGCSLAGCDDTSREALHGRRAGWRDAPQATVVGSGERLDLPTVAALGVLAATGSGFAAEHPPCALPLGAIVASTLMPVAEWRAASGGALLDAYAFGMEVAVRLADATEQRDGNALLAAGIGATLACAHLLELDAAQSKRAIEEAIAHCGALDDGSEPYRNAAEVARNALTAAVAALEQNAPCRTGADDSRTMQTLRYAIEPRLLEGLGRHWQLQRIAYKTYPCPRTLHPVIEACQALQMRYRPSASAIDAVELRVHPAVLAQAAHRDPEDIGQARRSLHHTAAAALLHGSAPRQFDARELRSARTAALRARIDAQADDTLGLDGAQACVRMQDGRVWESRIRCARGGPTRPLSDAELAENFRNLAANVLATGQTERLLALAWTLPALSDAGALVRTSVPEEEAEAAELPGSPLIPR